MQNILELDENRIYVEDEKWSCHFGFGKPVKLGLVLEAIDLTKESDQESSFVINANVIPQPENLDNEIIQQAMHEGASTREDIICYVYENYGGVPVNIDALQPAKASCGFSSFIADSSIGSVESLKGEEVEVRQFQDQTEAMKFARHFYAVYAGGLFSFIDLVLDNPLSCGGTGWDKIRDLAGASFASSKNS
jgi:hypothetical protein